MAVDDLGDGFGKSTQTQVPVDPNVICVCMRLTLERLVTAIETAPETPALAIGVHLDDDMMLSEDPAVATFLREPCGSPGDRAHRAVELERHRTDSGALMANRAVEPPAPSRAGSAEALARRYVQPSADAEAKLVEIWADVLGVSNVGVLDDFFELGGDSLSAMRLVERVRREMCGTLTGAALFQAPTVKQLVQLIVGQPTQKPPIAENLPAFCVHPAGRSVMQRLE